MATQNVNNNNANVVSSNSINVTSADDINITSSDTITISSTNNLIMKSTSAGVAGIQALGTGSDVGLYADLDIVLQTNTGQTIMVTPDTDAVHSAGFKIDNGFSTGYIFVGTGNPNGVVTATPNSIYMNNGGTSIADRVYVNSGGDVWISIVTGM